MMEKIKRAILLAAGRGRRMKPITDYTPKPLIPVNGTPMIETVIKGVKEQNIDEIIIVVGYRPEDFLFLQQKYTGIKFVKNEEYYSSNTISSAYYAREYFDEAVVILCSDVILNNSNVLAGPIEKSITCCQKINTGAKEWTMDVNQKKIVTDIHREDEPALQWQMSYISMYTKADAEKLRGYLEDEWENKNNRQIYFEEIVFMIHPEEFEIQMREIEEGDQIEIDNVEELCKIDQSYNKYL